MKEMKCLGARPGLRSTTGTTCFAVPGVSLRGLSKGILRSDFLTKGASLMNCDPSNIGMEWEGLSTPSTFPATVVIMTLFKAHDVEGSN